MSKRQVRALQETVGKNRRNDSGVYLLQCIHRIDENGKKYIGDFVIGRAYHERADYIYSAYQNVDGSRVAYALTFDIDAKNGETSPEWLDEEGRVDWDKIYTFLKTEHPEISEHILFAARSPGGRGLGCGLAISPLLINESKESKKVQGYAKSLQKAIIRLLRSKSIGCDECAIGAARATPNWRKTNTEGSKVHRLFFNPFVRAKIKRENINVISELLKYTNKLPECREETKSQKKELAHTDKRTEHGWAKLYLHLFDCLSYQADLSMKELLEITGLSRFTLLNTIKGRIKNPPKWLKFEYINRDEGYRLWIDFSVEQPCVERAKDLAKGKVLGTSVIKNLGCPTTVEDGKTNEWVFSAIVSAKFCNMPKHETKRRVGELVSFIPGCEESYSCNHIDQMVDRLYRCRPETLGIKDIGELPEVLTSEYLGKLKLLERPPGQRLLCIDLSFKRKDMERYAVAYRNGAVLAVSKMDGNKFKDQLLGVESILTTFKTKPESITVRGLNYLENNPTTVKFAEHHGLSFSFEKGEKIDFDPAKSRSGARVIEAFKHPVQQECKVRCDGHVKYQGAYYWIGSNFAGGKGYVLDNGKGLEFWFVMARVVTQEKLANGKVSGPEARLKKAWVDICKSGSWLRQRSSSVGKAFDQYYLNVLENGKGLVDTRYLQFLGGKGYPSEQLNAVANHCLMAKRFSFKYFKSCLDHAIF